jgi:hypothetical protein
MGKKSHTKKFTDPTHIMYYPGPVPPRNVTSPMLGGKGGGLVPKCNWLFPWRIHQSIRHMYVFFIVNAFKMSMDYTKCGSNM